MTPAAVTPSASSASSRPFIPVTDDPGAASIIAETMTKAKEVRGLPDGSALKACEPHAGLQRQHTGGSLHAGRAGHSPPSPPGRSAHSASQGFSSLPRRSGSCPRRSVQVRAPGRAVSLVLTEGHWLCALLSVCVGGRGGR